jgi:hypothetical protein
MKLLSLIFSLLVFNGCISRSSNMERLNGSKNKLSAKIFPNISSVCEYIAENVKDNKFNYNDVINKLHYNFFQTEHSKLMGYNWYNGIIIADINQDGIFELYLNGSIGSGIIHSFIHCYDPTEDKYYIINKKLEMDYILFVYKNDIYVYENNKMFSKDDVEIKLYKPLFVNNEMIFEKLEINLYNEIINVYDFRNIYHQFNGDLIRDNYIK